MSWSLPGTTSTRPVHCVDTQPPTLPPPKTVSKTGEQKGLPIAQVGPPGLAVGRWDAPGLKVVGVAAGHVPQAPTAQDVAPGLRE